MDQQLIDKITSVLTGQPLKEGYVAQLMADKSHYAVYLALTKNYGCKFVRGGGLGHDNEFEGNHNSIYTHKDGSWEIQTGHGKSFTGKTPQELETYFEVN